MIFVNENGNIIEAECRNCGRIMKFRKNMLQYNAQNHIYMLPEPVECFCETESDAITNVPEQRQSEGSSSPQATGMVTSKPSTSTPVYSTPQNVRNIPRCPTCGSENVQKISLTSKAVGGYLFGVFSSNIRNTYKCLNCGYKW